jgi:glycosyltransferase involved in cell wall biosynthesis
MAKDNKQIAIITSCQDDWGGSEELWARAIPYLQSAGYGITILKRNLNKQHNQYVGLASQGVELVELLPEESILRGTKNPSVPRKAIASLVSAIFKFYNKVFSHVITIVKRNNSHYFYHDYWVRKKLQRIKPQLVIVSQGINFDGLSLAHNCAQLGIPYILIVQKAVDYYWPYHLGRVAMRNLYLNASWSYFVSHHNKRLTEEQFGTRFLKSEVIYNTVKVTRKVIPMPATDNGYRLACVGRYFLMDKGQDILIRIMALPKWKSRPLTVSFFGSGIDKKALMEMAELLNVENVKFFDYTEHIEALWENHHALILPARSEGLPLVILEAMACGRPAIVSMAGGNSEVIKDGVNGFIGHANEDDFDHAMERAWNAREEWDTIGHRAFVFIQENVPCQPEKKFAESILTKIAD